MPRTRPYQAQVIAAFAAQGLKLKIFARVSCLHDGDPGCKTHTPTGIPLPAVGLQEVGRGKPYRFDAFLYRSAADAATIMKPVGARPRHNTALGGTIRSLRRGNVLVTAVVSVAGIRPFLVGQVAAAPAGSIEKALASLPARGR
jgi:hypothetical protein